MEKWIFVVKRQSGVTPRLLTESDKETDALPTVTESVHEYALLNYLLNCSFRGQMYISSIRRISITRVLLPLSLAASLFVCLSCSFYVALFLPPLPSLSSHTLFNLSLSLSLSVCLSLSLSHTHAHTHIPPCFNICRWFKTVEICTAKYPSHAMPTSF